MIDEKPQPIGQANKKWGSAERTQWLELQNVKRSYQKQVLDQIDNLSDQFAAHQYFSLSYDPVRYPLMVINSLNQDPNKPTALVTGGVHGYETSGIQGAIRFAETKMQHYSDTFNIIVAPCISPWAYETINRWNPNAVDPNRSFSDDGQSEEAISLMDYVNSLNTDIALHIDLHETTDTDNTEFRPALSARDNVYHEFWEIPDGFYLVGDTENPCNEFQTHIINAVAKVTHIAPSDDDGRIIGEKITQTGVINYPTKALGLCAGFSKAGFNTTTEVYPDSPLVDDENCILAQVTAVCSALDFVKTHR